MSNMYSLNTHTYALILCSKEVYQTVKFREKNIEKLVSHWLVLPKDETVEMEICKAYYMCIKHNTTNISLTVYL